MKLETASELRKTQKNLSPAVQENLRFNLRFYHLRLSLCIGGEEIDRKRDALAKLLLAAFSTSSLPQYKEIRGGGGEHDTRLVF